MPTLLFTTMSTVQGDVALHCSDWLILHLLQVMKRTEKMPVYHSTVAAKTSIAFRAGHVLKRVRGSQAADVPRMYTAPGVSKPSCSLAGSCWLESSLVEYYRTQPKSSKSCSLMVSCVCTSVLLHFGTLLHAGA